MTIDRQEERFMQTTETVAGGALAEGHEPVEQALAPAPAVADAADRPTWATIAWWASALIAASAATLLVYAYPALAQQGGEAIDTCQAGGGVGGEGGQKILNGIKNIALFGAATIGGLAVLGLIASAAMIMLGSTSKDWQRRGFTGLALAGVGIFLALGAASIYGIIQWAICGGA